MVLDIFEKTCGARMSMNYNVIGGVVADIHPDFVKDVKALVEIMPERLKEYHTVFTNNLIARNRLEGVGLLRKEDAVSYDITGPSGRGLRMELRLPQEASVRRIRPRGVRRGSP